MNRPPQLLPLLAGEVLQPALLGVIMEAVRGITGHAAYFRRGADLGIPWGR